MTSRPRLMLSYAHEDRDFARALYGELARDFDVWFDETSMQIGDSLFQKISAGVGQSDYGIVILSPDYLKKVWTMRELGGLLAVEEQTGRMILPVRLGIDQATVAKQLSILADRLAADGTNGAAATAAELRSKIAVASRAAELVSGSSSASRLAAFGRKLKTDAETETLLRTPEGARMTVGEFAQLADELEQKLRSAESSGLGFRFSRSEVAFSAATRDRMTLGIQFAQQYGNDVVGAKLKTGVVQRPDSFDETGETTTWHEVTYTPWVEGGKVVWKSEEGHLATIADVRDRCIEMLLDALQQQSGDR